MAKKSTRKNRSARERARLQEELAKRQAAELDRELRFILGCLAVASIMLAAILVFV